MTSEHEHYGWLCPDCAKELGGVIPQGHACTMHGGRCPHCGELRILANHDDWNWPGQTAYPGRD